MSVLLIQSQEQFLDVCEHIREAGRVAFDTEFVSESTYRPALGLLQFATESETCAVDPLELDDLTPWWEIMADNQTDVIVHGGQAEIRFCLQALGRPPARLFDIQVAEGFRSRSYPLSYSAIVNRVLNRRVDGSQTRTDWTRRPLSEDQLRYAVEDVTHVLEIHNRQCSWLTERNRLDWATAEMQRLVDDIAADGKTRPWERISGVHKLSRRELAILQQLADWREDSAAERNRPVRRVMRDDLLIDLARRKPRNAQQAMATRDLNRPEYKRQLDHIVAVIQEALGIPDDDLPPRVGSRRQESTSDEQVISKLLSLSLANRCAELEISQTLVANNRELTELVRYHRFSDRRSGKPRLLSGWRNDQFGQLLLDVMDGHVGFRVSPPGSDTPLLFQRSETDS
jgi:ribonuclease D